MKEIFSFSELRDLLEIHKKVYLLLWKQGAEQSECAYHALNTAAELHPEIAVLSANVNIVRDIHPVYHLYTAPSLLQFEGLELKNIFKGCQKENFYKSLLEEAIYQASVKENGKPQKSVTVYSTPTCSWCNTLKQWLRKNHIVYTEIDVSRDEQASKDLVRRSGQHGVPQIEISGQIVVGFDQTRLKQLLEI